MITMRHRGLYIYELALVVSFQNFKVQTIVTLKESIKVTLIETKI